MGREGRRIAVEQFDSRRVVKEFLACTRRFSMGRRIR